MARLVLLALCGLLAWVPAASAATPAELIGAYAVERDAAIAHAREAVAGAGAGTPGARAAAGDLRARLGTLAAALTASTDGAGPEVAAAVASRVAGDGDVVHALERHAAGELDAAGLDALLTRIERDHARRAGTAGTGSMGLADIVQAVGGPALLIGVVTALSWRGARRRRQPASR